MRHLLIGLVAGLIFSCSSAYQMKSLPGFPRKVIGDTGAPLCLPESFKIFHTGNYESWQPAAEGIDPSMVEFWKNYTIESRPEVVIFLDTTDYVNSA